MAVAAPPDRPSARKKRKSGALPEGVEQHSLDALFALAQVREQPEALPAPAIEAQPVSIHPGQTKQLDFYALADQEPDTGGWKPGVSGNTGAARPTATPRRRKTRKPAALPEASHSSP